jgi:hypothetical protein
MHGKESLKTAPAADVQNDATPVETSSAAVVTVEKFVTPDDVQHFAVDKLTPGKQPTGIDETRPLARRGNLFDTPTDAKNKGGTPTDAKNKGEAEEVTPVRTKMMQAV